VVRLPPVIPSYPTFALREQAAVLDVLAESDVPVPGVVAVEEDPHWVGAPFLVTTFVDGRTVGDVPARDAWLMDFTAEQQRRVHEDFIAVLAALHRVDWDHIEVRDTLRIGIGDEIEYWLRYVKWAAGGAPARGLVTALEWCAATAVEGDVPLSLLWGDARVGNVMFDKRGRIVALVDWEMATVGPAEMDLAWYLVLEDIMTHFGAPAVPGFLARKDVVAAYEHALGRAVSNLAWHEIFALARSVAVNDCQARAAMTAGRPYPGIPGDDNPVLPLLTKRIAAFDG
jgi:aminoglycoside phosphotransferase (APT) family kinase protein